MKKFILTMIAVILVFTLLGCSKANTPKVTAPSTQQQTSAVSEQISKEQAAVAKINVETAQGQAVIESKMEEKLNELDKALDDLLQSLGNLQL